MSRIPEIIDNRNNLLKDTINTLIKYAYKVEIATGYFYLNGFDLIKENINPNCTIDIIIGDETDVITANEISSGYEQKKSLLINSIEKDILYLDEEQKQQVYDLSQLIKDGKVNFKIYLKDKFHSKAYLLDVGYNNGEIKEQYAIVGSSNFTKSGLGDLDNRSNTELNAVLRQPSAIKEVKNWYNEIWEEAEDFNKELLNIIDNNTRFETHDFSPFDILLKTLYEYLKGETIFEEIQALDLDDLTEFQEFAVHKAIQILEKYNGVIIADSVGLGKTYVAKGLLKYFSLQNKNVLIISPGSLKNMWRYESSDLDLNINVITQEKIGKKGISSAAIQNVETIIIDEAHNFRNQNANRYKELIKVTMGKKIVQLTATPINNSIYDLYNILTLFLKEDDFKKEFGIARLKDIFKDYDNKKDEVSNILNEVMIRRSRTFIRNKYGNSDRALYIKNQELKFPTRKLKKISYSISDLYGENIYNEIANIIENLNLPIISEEFLSEGQQFYNKSLVKTIFLKRFESSVEAFRNSIMKQLKYCDLLLDSMEAGYLLLKKEVMDELNSDNFEIDVNVTKVELSNYNGNLNELVDQIKIDKQNLSEIIKLIKSIDNEKDIKLQTLKNHLRLNNNTKKLLIFTQFKDTARYLFKYLRDNDFGIVAELDSQNNYNNKKEELVAQFAPKANPSMFNPDNSEIDILITTDILSEGQNLQDCNTIINYDLTWNPVRIIQREGRIDRITTNHDEIYIYNFIPDDKLDSILNLTQRLAKKIEYINETIGNESRIISDDEILIEKVFNEKHQNQIKRINEEDQTILDELEQEGEDILPSDEYIYEDYKELIYSNESNRKFAELLPDGIYSIKRSDTNKGVFIYYQTSNTDYWLFYDAKSNEFRTNKSEIYKLISTGYYLKSKPINRRINMNIKEILKLGEQYVINHLNNIAQIQVASTEIDIVQKNIAARLESVFSKAKFRNRITREQRGIRKKLKNPLHRGTINQLKAINLSSMNDEELISKLDKILEYINLEEKKKSQQKNNDIRLICYEVFI